MGVESRYERIEKIKTLIEELNNASIAYYTSVPIMSDYDWDKKYEELQQLERQENIIFPNSPTQNVGYTVSDKLNEVKLDHLMLSLDKTKSIKSDNFYDFSIEDFSLENYNPIKPQLKLELGV